MNEYKIKLAEMMIEKDKIINELMEENEWLMEENEWLREQLENKE